MKSLLVFFFSLASPLAYAQSANPPQLKAPRQTKYDPQVYEATKNGISMSVSYLDPKECAAAFEKEATLNRWSESQRTEERTKIPKGGYLKGSWARDTPGLASADNFVFLVEAPNGQEIRRWTPERSIPHPFSILGTTVYSELTLVPLPEALPDGARVFVIEAPVKKRFEYVIHP